MSAVNATPSDKQILLLGAGHANLAVVRNARRLAAAGAKITLVDENPFWFFADMAPGVINGAYGLKDFRLDLRTFAQQHEVDFIQDQVVSLLPENRKVMTATGRIFTYDYASLALGSIAREREGDVPAEGSFTLSPIRRVLEIRNELETLLEMYEDKPLEVVVVGAGQSGVECLFHLNDLLEERRPAVRWRLILIEAQAGILPGWPAAVVQAVEKMLRVVDVEVRTNITVQHVQSNRLVLEKGETMEFDLAVVATGNQVSDLFVRAGMKTDDFGAVAVTPQLQVRNYDQLFATGDCAQAPSRAARFAARTAMAQGPVLVHNLLAAMTGKAMKPFRWSAPKVRLLSLGKTETIALYRGRVWQGAYLAAWKNWRNQRYMRSLLKAV